MYGRALAVIYLDGENINGELIKKGLVEIYTPANHNNGVYDK
jgi:endonuclease YncB( thermonuclease family)